MKIGAVITAAGLSSRMGDFKPLLPYKNTTMLRFIIGLLRAAGAEEIVVVAGYRAADLKAHVADLNVRIVENREYASTQMFDSVKLGLAALSGRCERAAFMPVDVPDVSVSLARRVFAEKGAIVRPVYQGRPGHPVVFDSTLIEKICAYQGEGGLRGAMEAAGCGIVEIEAEDEGIYRDLDTMEDYRALLRKTEGAEQIEKEQAEPIEKAEKIIESEAAGRMKIPGEEEIRRLFSCCNTPEHVIRHCQAVADEAVRLTRSLNAQGQALNEELVFAAAMLHDVLRLQKKHAGRGAEFLSQEGYPEIAEIVRQHDSLDEVKISEAAVVYYADKRYIGEQKVSLEERFRRSAEKTVGNEAARKAHAGRYAQAQEVQALFAAVLS